MFKKIMYLALITFLVSIMSIVGFSKTFEFKLFGHVPGHIERFMEDKFIELVNEKSEHEIKVKRSIEGEVATSGNLIEAIKAGILDMGASSPSWATSWDKRIGLFETPFLWKSYSHFQNYVIEEGGGEKLGQILIEKAGVRPLAWYSKGYRWMYFTDRINSLEGLRKVKMRTPGGQSYLDMMKIIGINAISVPWGEVFVSLKTGLVNGVECPPGQAHEQGFDEVTKYAWPSKHIMGVGYLVINENLWQSLPEDLKDAMNEAAYETSYYMLGFTPMYNQKAIRNMKEKLGVEVIYNVVDPDVLAGLFVDYHMNLAKEYDLVDTMEKILKME